MQPPLHCGFSRKAPEPSVPGLSWPREQQEPGARSQAWTPVSRGVPTRSLGPGSPATSQALTPNSNSEQQLQARPATRPVRTLSFRWAVCEGSLLPQTHSFRPP